MWVDVREERQREKRKEQKDKVTGQQRLCPTLKARKFF